MMKVRRDYDDKESFDDARGKVLANKSVYEEKLVRKSMAEGKVMVRKCSEAPRHKSPGAAWPRLGTT